MYRVLTFGMRPGFNGISTSMMNLYRNMDRSKVQWDFAIFKEYRELIESKKLKSEYVKEIQDLGGRVYYLNYSQSEIPGYTRKQIKELMQNDSEIMGVHVHDVSLLTYPLYLAKRLDKPIRIIQFHTGCAKSRLKELTNNPPRQKRSRLRMIQGDEYDRWACADISGQFAYNGLPFEIFPNALDTRKHAFNKMYRKLLRQQMNIPEDAVVFGFIATLYDIKNPVFAVKIFEEYLRKYNDAYFVMIGDGDGDMVSEIMGYIEKNQLSHRALMIGKQTAADAFYSVFDLFLCPSIREGFPNTLVEAQCTGCLCLVSDEITELVRLTNLVEFCSLDSSPDIWAEVAHDMLRNAEPRMSREDEIKKEGYDIRDAADRLVEHYLRRIREWENY